jgi:hypothetical protein
LEKEGRGLQEKGYPADCEIWRRKNHGMGCMGWNGPGILCEVEGTIDAKQDVDILESVLLESLEKLGVSPENIYFQQDGDGKHTSNLAWN